MASERQKIDYAKSVLTRKYLGSSLASGLLTTGKTYLVTRFRCGDDFRNIGASCNRTGAVFTATGTTATTWTEGSVLHEIDLAGLKSEANTVYAAATQTVTITSGNFEGGSGSGELTFETTLLGLALKEMLEWLDPDHVAPVRSAAGFIMQLGGAC